jgi:hypothetical protein
VGTHISLCPVVVRSPAPRGSLGYGGFGQMTIRIPGEARERMRWTLTSGSDDLAGGS